LAVGSVGQSITRHKVDHESGYLAGQRDIRVDTVPDPQIKEPTDVIIKVTSTGLCGSDLHLYEVIGPFLDAGDILGHEPTGVVEEVGVRLPS
jgi:threonine dehydrogenase-like Zn-dependent dehydrogenase